MKIAITAPSYQAPDGVYIDPATGQTGVVHTYHRGVPTTKVATFHIH